jgi:N-acetylmuramoyl-L-alanine amidase
MRSLLRALGCAGMLLVAASPVVATGSAPPATAARSAAIAGHTRPLTGRTVVVDPGHQLGNSPAPAGDDGAGRGRRRRAQGVQHHRHHDRRRLPGGNVRVAGRGRRRDRLRRLGATVLMTRPDNSAEEWGPCVDRRGRLGNASADLKLSIHGDGSAAGNHGFHVIVGDRGHRAGRVGAVRGADEGRAGARGLRPVELRRRRLRSRRARRPGHAQLVPDPDGDGGAGQHARPGGRGPDDLAGRTARLRDGPRGGRAALPGA